MGRSADKPLTPRELLFIETVMTGKAAGQAAIEAGYSVRSARTVGPKLLQKAAVAAEVQKRRAQLTKKTESLQDRVLAELEKLAFSNIEDFTRLTYDGVRVVDFSNATRDQLAAINKIETKVRKVYTPRGDHIGTETSVKVAKEDKLRALQMLGQTAGMFKPDEVKVTVDVADRLLAARQRMSSLAAPEHEEAE